MIRVFKEPATGGALLLVQQEQQFDRQFFLRDMAQQYLTIAWNQGPEQTVVIDEVHHRFPAQSILPLVVQQSFRFEHPEHIVAWQFNRDFYCIIDNDREVSCVGFIFYGSTTAMFIQPGEKEHRQFSQLLESFQDEMDNADDVQGAMLRTMMVRLIILLTRLAKQQFLNPTLLQDNKVDIIRQFNLLVELHYKSKHQVQFYAQELNKSPKTLSNLFSLYNHKSPLQVIQDRLILEAKRLFNYTEKSTKEIAGDLGFDDAAHFSRFFKNQADITPTDYKKSLQERA